MKKHIISWLLVFCMVLGLMPVNAFAETETEETLMTTIPISITELPGIKSLEVEGIDVAHYEVTNGGNYSLQYINIYVADEYQNSKVTYRFAAYDGYEIIDRNTKMAVEPQEATLVNGSYQANQLPLCHGLAGTDKLSKFYVTFYPILRLDITEATLTKDQEQILTPVLADNVVDGTPAYTWATSDSSVATVDENGVVTAVGYGEATITVSIDGHSAACQIKVPPAIYFGTGSPHKMAYVSMIYSDGLKDILDHVKDSDSLNPVVYLNKTITSAEDIPAVTYDSYVSSASYRLDVTVGDVTVVDGVATQVISADRVRVRDNVVQQTATWTITYKTACTEHPGEDAAEIVDPTCENAGSSTYTCTECGKKIAEEIPALGHVWDEGKVTTEPTCGKAGVKTYTCTTCDEPKEEAIEATGKHTWDEGKVTTAATCEKDGVKTFTCACGETKTEVIKATGHTWGEGKVTTAATCEKDGVKTFTCACGETKTEVIKATGHTWGEPVLTGATADSEGTYVKTCACGAAETVSKIAKIASVELEKTTYTYNKKAKKPAVVVKDTEGNTLTEGTDYTVAYAKGRKKVGNYKVTVTFAGKYSGTEELTFSIVPKASKVSSLKAGTKKLTVKVKKQTSQTTGYQIQYSLKKNFKNAKTKLVKKNKKTSLTISKLKSNKTYYVRVRTYKQVKVNGKAAKIYSSWSAAKKVKVK